MGRFPFKAGNSVEIKYADEAAFCEFAPPEDFQHEWIFSNGFCYLESPDAITTIEIDHLSYFIHTQEKRAGRKKRFLF